MGKKSWLIVLNAVLLLLICLASMWAYQAYAKRHTEAFIIKRQAELKPDQQAKMRTGKVGSAYVTAYLPEDDKGELIEPLEAGVYSLVRQILGEKPAQKKIDQLLFVSVKDTTTNFSNIRKFQIQAESYKVSGLSIQKMNDQPQHTVFLTQDNTVFTLDALFSDVVAARSVFARQLEQDLQARSISEQEFSQYVAQFEQADLSTLSFTYQDSQLTIDLPESLAEVAHLTVPISALFEVIRADYLSEEDKTAYDTYKAEQEAKKKQKQIALTFDDGPSAVTTPQVLDILKKYNIRATFFILGQNVAGNEAILKRAVAEGHELGNHSFTHPVLTKLSADQVKEEVTKTQQAVQGATGVLPKFLRPPYGAVNQAVLSASNLPAIYWSIDSLDWKSRNPQAILAQIKSASQPGGIILMHDIHQPTVDSLATVIDYLLGQGYSFVTVSDLLGDNLNPSYVYYNQHSASPAN